MTLSTAKRILIYDHRYTGHHLKYVQLLVDGLYKRGHSISFAALPEAFVSDEYSTLLAPSEDRFQKVELAPTFSREVHLRTMTHCWRILRAAQSGRYDFVLLPCLDSYFFQLGLLMKCVYQRISTPIEGILLFADYTYREQVYSTSKNCLKRLVARMILKTGAFHRILFVDELQYPFALALGNDLKTRCELCPDPVETRRPVLHAALQTKYGIPQGAKVLGVFGGIRPSKGVDCLIKAFVAYGPKADEYLMIMGRHSWEIIDLLASMPKYRNIISVNSFVSDEEMFSAINAVDVVAAVHRRHVGSSSMVIRSAAAGKPVLASDFGWIGHTVRKHGLGRVCNVLNQDSLLEGIRWAFNSPTIDRGRARAFGEQNCLERFINLVSCGIEQ